MTNDKGNPNDQNPNRSAGLLFGTILHGGTHNAARNWGSSFGFMKRIDQSEFVHCCQNTLALPRRTKSADKSDALQTLRALLRHPAGAKRLECVRLQRRFPDGAWDSLARQVNRGLSWVFRMHGDLEQVRRRPPRRGPITQSRARTRMTTRTTGHSTEWTWRRAFLGVALAVASLPLAVGKQKHWERARVEAEILNPHEVQIRSENVTGLTLSLPAGLCPLDTTLRPEVQVNGQMLEAPRVQADGSWKVRLMEGGGRWSVVHSFEDGLLRKRHGLQGPIDDAFVDPFMMVAPTGQAWNESIGRWTTNEVAHPSNETAKRTP